MSNNSWPQQHQSGQNLPFLVTQSHIPAIYSNNNNSNSVSDVPLSLTSQSNPATFQNTINDEGEQFCPMELQRNNEGLLLPSTSGINMTKNNPDLETFILPVENYQNNREYIYRVKCNRSISKELQLAAAEDEAGEDISNKKMGPKCESVECDRSAFRFCSSFTEETRQKIFDEFWKHLNWDQRHIFVATHVFNNPRCSSSLKEEKKKCDDLIYTLRNSNGSDEQVCENMFLNTLALTIERVKLWVQKYSIGGDGTSMYKEEFKRKNATIKIYDPNDYDEKGLPKKRRKYKKKLSKRDLEELAKGNTIISREYDPNCPNKPPREKHTIKPEYWKCNVAKKLRMEGKEYYSKNSKTGELVLHKGKDLGPRCTSKLCKISKVRHCCEISDETRKKIFDDIWQRWDWYQRKVWVASMVKRKPPSRKRTLSINSKRQMTLHYFLPNDKGIPLQVCKKMFTETTAIGHHQTLIWTNTYSLGSNFEENIISTKDADNHAIDWIDALPKYNSSSKSDLKYLDPQFKTFGDLYKIYSERCKKDGIKLTERYQIKNLVRVKKIELVPQNDEECEKCKIFGKAKEKDTTDETFKYHQQRIEQGTEEKLKDQKKALTGVYHVLQIHLQPIKTVPIIRNVDQLFKKKLQCNNLSIYDTRTNFTTCYFFTEDQCPNIVENFVNICTSIICEHLKKQYLIAKKNFPIILYCNGDNIETRNVILSNALLNLATIYNVKITQKFFLSGHSLVEDCYKPHQMLERFLNSKNKEIYLPSQMSKTMREIKRYPEIFTGIHLDYDFFHDYSKSEYLRYKSIHPGDGFEENDACEIQYHSSGKIKLKLDFNGECMDLLQKSAKDFKPIFNYLPLYSEMAYISKTKWDDLQDLKKFMPFDCQPFYDSLKYYED